MTPAPRAETLDESHPLINAIVACLIGVGLVFSILALPSGFDPAGASADPEHPDIILIVTDDQPASLLNWMPRTNQLLTSRGTLFTQAHAPTSTCCPARSSLLTGMESRHTGVWTNWAPAGGWSVFHDSGWENDTIATRLRAAGYKTALVGKYLNEYDLASNRERVTGSRDFVPPGWDYWDVFATGDPAAPQTSRYFDYTLMRRPTIDAPVTYQPYGDKPSEYSTTVTAASVVNFIGSVPEGKPLFAMWTPSAPHTPYDRPNGKNPVTRSQRLSFPVPSTVATGKPPWVSERKPATGKQVRQVMAKQIATLETVDEGVASIVEALRAAGRLDTTLIVFTSDNGYLLGEYGMLAMKNAPYPASTQVPLVVAGPGFDAGRVDERLVMLPDVTATLLAAAHVRSRVTTDGLALQPSRDPEVDPGEWREGFPLSAWRNRGEDPAGNQPSYCGWRTRDWLFVQYSERIPGSVQDTGWREMYDLANDPGATVNLAGSPQWAEMEQRLAGQAQVTCDPAPPDFTWPVTPITPGTRI